MNTKPQLNRLGRETQDMEIFFINRNNMSILLNSKGMEKQEIFNLSQDDIHSLFPDDPNVGDLCIITTDFQSSKKWFLGKNVWQDFDYNKINKAQYSHLSEYKLTNSHYLFTYNNTKYEKLSETYEYLFDFCNQHNLQINAILEIFPTETPRSNDAEIVVDIYFAIQNEIPKQLLEQYLPFKIHRRKYNFFTY
ncbi:MAG: hypothetical protein HeimC2_12460 [Candidatus Heimdallarchaeota archaeon LC_2]|nr:MAG: hypothetical protein HeimC2_12460 [Candidatus Heimdallarchaeota archaeon LC_2]